MKKADISWQFSLNVWICTPMPMTPVERQLARVQTGSHASPRGPSQWPDWWIEPEAFLGRFRLSSHTRV